MSGKGVEDACFDRGVHLIYSEAFSSLTMVEELYTPTQTKPDHESNEIATR